MKGGLVSVTRNKVLAQKIRYCNNFFTRIKGLLGTSKLDPNEACWIIPCNMVHTFGMQYPIDVAFLNKNNEVVSVVENLKPNRFSPLVKNAHSVLELAPGIHNLKPGERLGWESSQ